MTQDGPLFDNSKSALVFALNADDAVMPRPFMSKAMTEVRATPAKKETKKEELTKAARQLRLEPRQASLRGLEAAAQAGMILALFRQLDQPHQVILTALLAKPWTPCSCGSPCCSGKRLTRRYVEAFRQLEEIVREAGAIPRADGKQQGPSHQPRLHALVIEQFVQKQASTLTTLARDADVSLTTAAKHRDWILAVLAQLETDAWLEIDPILTQAGVVGHLG